MSTLLFIHERLAVALILLTAVTAFLSLLGLLRRVGAGGTARALIILSGLLWILQDILGITLFASGKRPEEFLHYIYGVIGPIFLFGGYAYSKTRAERGEAIIIMVAALLSMVVAIRALMTG
jgi:hypothetical protein